MNEDLLKLDQDLSGMLSGSAEDVRSMFKSRITALMKYIPSKTLSRLKDYEAMDRQLSKNCPQEENQTLHDYEEKQVSQGIG